MFFSIAAGFSVSNTGKEDVDMFRLSKWLNKRRIKISKCAVGDTFNVIVHVRYLIRGQVNEGNSVAEFKGTMCVEDPKKQRIGFKLAVESARIGIPAIERTVDLRNNALWVGGQILFWRRRNVEVDTIGTLRSFEQAAIAA